MVTIIGISGVGGSGKTTLVEALGKVLKATTVLWDDYDPLSQGPDDYIAWYENSRDCNDWKYDALAETLSSLKHGKTVFCPATRRELAPTEYVIFDAPLGRKHEATGQWIDLLVFLDTPPDIALARRIIRDYHASKGSEDKDIVEELEHYLAKARPVYMESYNGKEECDLLLDGSLSLEMLESQVLGCLRSSR